MESSQKRPCAADGTRSISDVRSALGRGSAEEAVFILKELLNEGSYDGFVFMGSVLCTSMLTNLITDEYKTELQKLLFVDFEEFPITSQDIILGLNCFLTASKKRSPEVGMADFQFAHYLRDEADILDDEELKTRADEILTKVYGELRDPYITGYCLYHGLVVLPNKSASFVQLKQAAEAGVVEAQEMVGKMYYLGEGTLSNMEEAVVWYQKAAENGDPFSQWFLGDLYFAGDMPEGRNRTKAWRWFRKAANQGYEDAEEELRQREFVNFAQFDLVHRSCMTFIMIRKFRRKEHALLSLLPMDVVIYIAKKLWETRSDPAWFVVDEIQKTLDPFVVRHDFSELWRRHQLEAAEHDPYYF